MCTVVYVQEIVSFWESKADPSSSNKLVRQRVGPKQYNSANVMYTTKSDAAIWADFVEEHPVWVQWVSQSAFNKLKPFYLKPHKWLTCKCSSCHEIEGFLEAFVRNVPVWHKQAIKNGNIINSRPPGTDHLEDGASETNCWHCRQHNPLYRSLASPSFVTTVECGSGLDALYQLSVCEHAVKFGAESTMKCAAAADTCTHGCGPLFAGHMRTATSEEKKQEGEEEEEEEKEILGVCENDGSRDIQAEPQAELKARRQLQMEKDLAVRGFWPVRPGDHGGCPVLEGVGVCKWREYQWTIQHFVDRKGVHREKKNQVLVEVEGTRQEFLATFKRKLLLWLPHKRLLLWDKMWSLNREVDGQVCSQRVKNMPVGQVDVRIDFIKNAELRSPNQAQREYFISIGLSLLCAVVQWKTESVQEGQELHSRTCMYMSSDRKHDGAFAAFAMENLLKSIPELLKLENWTTLNVYSDNGPHFAQTYVPYSLSCVL